MNVRLVLRSKNAVMSAAWYELSSVLPTWGADLGSVDSLEALELFGMVN